MINNSYHEKYLPSSWKITRNKITTKRKYVNPEEYEEDNREKTIFRLRAKAEFLNKLKEELPSQIVYISC